MYRLQPDVILQLPVWTAFIVILMVPVMWGVFSRWWYDHHKDSFYRVNLVIAISLFIGIFLVTVVSRVSLDLTDEGFDFIPFDGEWMYSFTIAGWANVIYNILLMEPLGMVVSNVLAAKKSNGSAFLFTVLIGLSFSVCIELIQHIFVLGVFELEDIICNTFGMAAGAAGVFIVRKNNGKEI